MKECESWQIGGGPAAIMAETTNIVKQNQSISDRHCSPSRNSCILLPISDPYSGLRRIPLMADLRHMRNLVRLLLDSRSVPQMGTNQPRNLPRPSLHAVRARRRAQSSLTGRFLRQYSGSSERTADHYRQHRPLDSRG